MKRVDGVAGWDEESWFYDRDFYVLLCFLITGSVKGHLMIL